MKRGNVLTANTFPETWDLKTLLDNWHRHLKGMVERAETTLPFERLLFQSQTDAVYENALSNWSKMSGEERRHTWDTLKTVSENNSDEMLPICVRCGICCKNGSPTLAKEDLELVANGQIPLEVLMTVREGEPVHSRTMDKVFYLPEEKIKLREHSGSKACVMYDDETKSCGLHPNKPAQCRAQACWDPALGSEQAMAPALHRKEVLDGAEGILTLLDAHEKRVPFAKVVGAFDTLAREGGKNVAEILDLLAFDDHVREFAQKEFTLPEAALDFVFGRRLTARMPLFGFKVVKEADGTHVLRPMDDNDAVEG